jgi:thiol:disulfide interchange protein DsbD
VGMAFVLGGIAAILAGACVAPAVVSVLLLSSDLWGRGQAIGLFLPFLLGLGMALPWPFAGAGLSFLPKAGKWMARVKYGFGVVILVAGIYYGYLGASLLRHGKGLGPETPKGWVVSLEEGLVLSEQNGKPVFIDFWASWCKACEKMERTTFQDQQVVAGLESFVKVKFDAEDQSDPKVKAVMDRYVTAGLPTYVILVSADSAAAAGGELRAISREERYSPRSSPCTAGACFRRIRTFSALRARRFRTSSFAGVSKRN